MSPLSLARFLPLSTLLVIAMLSAACGGEAPAGTPADGLGEPSVGGNTGQAAPAATLLLRDGSTTTLADAAAGKPVLLYFFATW